MTTRNTRKTARNAAPRKKPVNRRAKVQQRVVLDRPQPKLRPNKKTIYLTDEHAFRLSALAAMSSLNGRRYEQSSIVEEALTMWFEQTELPTEFTVKLGS
ncbi:MAG: hypothetical protein AAFY15_00050 [Cyanobacteria bacterium J06648_11]